MVHFSAFCSYCDAAISPHTLNEGIVERLNTNYKIYKAAWKTWESNNTSEVYITKAMEQALGNPLIVSNILSFISLKEGFLGCRLINRFWNQQVLAEYSKKDKIFLNLKTFLEQRKEKWNIAAGSPLPKRIYMEKTIPFRGMTSFFRCHDVETIRMEITELFCNMGTSLLKAIHEGLCPNLKHIMIEEHFGAERLPLPRTGDNFILRNLKTLDLWSGYYAKLSPAFAQSILDISPNLEVLRMTDMEILPTLQPNGKLKEFELTNSTSNRCIAEFELLLQQLSPNLEVLKVGNFGSPFDLPEWSFNLPTMPKLRTYSTLNLILNPFPIGDDNCGDLISFINKKMPALETLKIGNFWKHSWINEREVAKYDRPVHAISYCSNKRNITLKSLSIPGSKNPHLLNDIKKKFTALERIEVSLRIEYKPRKINSSAEEIAELAFALANSGVRENIVNIYCEKNRNIVERKAMNAIRPRCDQKGFKCLENVFFSKTGKEEESSVRITIEDPSFEIVHLGFTTVC